MITAAQKKYLRTILHDRGITIWIGQNGLTENVSREIENALDHHELIKIRVRHGDKDTRKQIISRICNDHDAILIQNTGSVASIYRRNPDNPGIHLPK